MSLNMYLGETDTQVSEMNAICKEIIQSMEETKTSIASFMFAFTLKGKAYDSAKSFMAQTYFPLAQGIIYLCEELIQQNEGYPSDFRSEVAPTDVIEQEILDQIKVIEGIIARLRALSNTVLLLSVSIAIYEAMKRKLEEKLERLYTFNGTSASNYEHAMDLAGEVAKGLTELENGKGFNSASGTFSTEGMDMDWATNIDKIHYEKLAHDLYPEYAGESDENLEKVIAIIKYEELNPKYVDQTNEFLSPLEEQDIVEIKFLMYTAEEPYRTLAMKYLDRFEIIILTPKIREEEKINSDGVFRHKEDVIYVEIGNLRKDDRGKYYTFFHEVAHAFDYYYGQDNKDILEEMMKQDGKKFNESTFFTDGYRIDGKTLAERMYEDAGNNFRMELAKELESSNYDDYSSGEKQEMIENYKCQYKGCINQIYLKGLPIIQHLMFMAV